MMKLDGFADICLPNLSTGEKPPVEKALGLRTCLPKNSTKVYGKRHAESANLNLCDHTPLMPKGTNLAIARMQIALLYTC